jgi:hypothetical protein
VVSASVSFDRSSLSLSALVASGAGPTYRITEEGLGRPAVSWRFAAMPDSSDVHGTEYTAAAKEQSSLPLVIDVYGSSTANLETACAALDAALSQFSYETTVTVDGVAQIWSCSPASWSTGLVHAEDVSSFLRTYTITIPVYPIPA